MRMRMKALAVSCLLLVLAMESAPAEPLETRIVTARGGLNVRQEPTVQILAVCHWVAFVLIVSIGRMVFCSISTASLVLWG